MPVFRVKGHTRDFPRILFLAMVALMLIIKAACQLTNQYYYTLKNQFPLPDSDLGLQFFTEKGGRAFIFIVTKGTNNPHPSCEIMKRLTNFIPDWRLYGKDN